MPLVNALPLNVFPGSPWSRTCPQQATELITTWNLEEQFALMSAPSPDIAWANVGTHTSQGVGIVKFGHSLPSGMMFQPFKSGTRTYQTLDAVVASVKVSPFDLNFAVPMIYDTIGNGYKLMSQAGDGTLMDFIGLPGLGAQYVVAGQVYKAMHVASLFDSGLYCSGGALTSTSPKAMAYGGAPMPNNPNGIALFTDGTGAEGTAGAQHFANPTVATSGRFKNVWTAFGKFATNYGASLTKMTIKPNAVFPNMTSGARVTDTFGPTYMREKFWAMMVQTLSLQTTTSPGNLAAATTNPYAQAVANGLSEDNFIGAAFGPRRFWIVPQLDNHPYAVASSNADFWINVSTTPLVGGLPSGSWAKLGCNSKDFVPTFKFYGPGDPKAQHDRMMRFEGDLDAGVAGGIPGVIDMFMET